MSAPGQRAEGSHKSSVITAMITSKITMSGIKICMVRPPPWGRVSVAVSGWEPSVLAWRRSASEGMASWWGS